MLAKREMLYEGKAKILYKEGKHTLIQYFKDEATAFNAQKKDVIAGKGVLNNLISAHLFGRLEEAGIDHHFIETLSAREQRVKAVDIIPVEVIVRNVAAGTLVKRLGFEEGAILPESLVEFCLKDDRLGDPLVASEHILLLKLAELSEIAIMKELALRVNGILQKLFLEIGVTLVDFKLEFGRLIGDDEKKIILADEISPDTCRLWDSKTQHRMDKDRFRQDMGGLIEAYRMIAERLGLDVDMNLGTTA